MTISKVMLWHNVGLITEAEAYRLLRRIAWEG